MRQAIVTVDEARRRIEQGGPLLLAGDEAALAALPRGPWVGGSTPYFMSQTQWGMTAKDSIFLTDFGGVFQGWELQRYTADTLASVYANAPQHGCSIILMPSFSETHRAFALNAPHYEHFGVRPLVGWVTGTHLDDQGARAPKVFDGVAGEMLEEGALVMAATLPEGKAVSVGIVNIFEQGEGDTLTFPDSGFSSSEVYVNGVRRRLVEYILEKQLDIKIPLVADSYGVSINSSFRRIDSGTGAVHFYAPVFSGIRYKHAKPVADYKQAFADRLAQGEAPEAGRIIYSCNCIVNYLHADLEGAKEAPFSGPITFGEIAYQLLNQTLVYMELIDL